MYYIISLNSKGEYNMKFGYFDDANREYVITTPKTPLPWINYLGYTPKRENISSRSKAAGKAV